MALAEMQEALAVGREERMALMDLALEREELRWAEVGYGVSAPRKDRNRIIKIF